MATNADDEEVEVKTSDIEDLQKDLEEASTKEPTEPEPSEEEPTKGEESPAEEQSEAPLTTETPDDKDLDWYKKAYSESTSEALKQKKRADDLEATQTSPAPIAEVKTDTIDPDKLYLEHLRTKDLSTVWTAVLGEYPQLADPNGNTYKKFVQRANVMGKTILEDEKRYVEPSELYPMVISSLGLNKGDDQDRLAAALKDGSATPKVNSGSAQKPTQFKVTDAMISMNMKMYPGKTRQEIIEELEPHII